ncbi:uncharacterized protein ASCRUDRAFT_74296 [Ascoidea rubescens DSM 1968]|uniref:ERT1/acuK family PAS domain-containing protein n=1 Tax=Ascoidea rubescens DSM 1968 TaxID=1344418 RepID=A0A1D2VMP4_9ASCO|nr:hypothetical protein ASCRUDRAFT_74296 [Ascoidea rubescens DSM 1968]ODV62837.1 hypothetical protein ASCRUDRAFT_74296 [Ascoidea rubescens DSM 1968]
MTYPDVIDVIEKKKKLNPAILHTNDAGLKSQISFSIGVQSDINNCSTNDSSFASASSNNNHSSTGDWGLRFKEPEEIYAKVKVPFGYKLGYHLLITYLRKRFNKDQLVKMAKSMTEYRPSFIACTITLKEDDLIFMEQCFQRTLLEYDKYISISGTPTIVWRRTGQICYVSQEFVILTGWTRDRLLKKGTFIVELMDDNSVIEYFDLFSKIAYGDFRGATMTSCTLLTCNGKKINTTCIWTLKRDVFGIPMMIVGNFLPILT